MEKQQEIFLSVPSKTFPNERTLSCPKCAGTDVTLQGKNLLGQGVNKTTCNSCGFTVIENGE
jgi:hypothetical protein